MDTSKKLAIVVVALVAAGVLFWRPWKKGDTTPEKFEVQAAFICVGCAKEFAESDVTIDLDDAHTGATCPACGAEKKLFRAHVCPKCGHRYVPTFASDPTASREDDKCPKCGTPTITPSP